MELYIIVYYMYSRSFQHNKPTVTERNYSSKGFLLFAQGWVDHIKKQGPSVRPLKPPLWLAEAIKPPLSPHADDR